MLILGRCRSSAWRFAACKTKNLFHVMSSSGLSVSQSGCTWLGLTDAKLSPQPSAARWLSLTLKCSYTAKLCELYGNNGCLFTLTRYGNVLVPSMQKGSWWCRRFFSFQSLQSLAIALATAKTVMFWSCYFSADRYFDVPGPIFAKLCYATWYVLI